MSGDFQLIHLATGKRLTIAMDGTELRDTTPPEKIEYCDKCETYKPFHQGKYERADGLAILWFCEACI